MTTVHFVGAGPGAADLITVRGARLLEAADVVVYAGSLVDYQLVRSWAPRAEVHDSAGLTLAETTRLLAAAVSSGRRAVRLHTGDPSLYGAIQEQMAELDRLGIGYEVIPGVTSAFAAAAALKQELTLPEVSQTVVVTRLAGRTPVPEREQLHRIAQLGATLVIYLSVGMIEEVVAQLLQGAYAPATPAAVVARASWPDQQVVEGPLAEIAGKVRAAGIDRQAVILVGDVLKARHEGLAAVSKLYDGTFAHGYRT
ncbi:MAG: precorrin-4 C(11)-methyltransferase [Deltaproteobacteria bacterium]|nr:MAG: precorrin-4 C(11)-methyltransferase [Deltaproteobacteria bacterium]